MSLKRLLALVAPLLAFGFVGTASGDALPYHARAMASVGAELPMADRVLVRKSERRLYLMRGTDVLRAYRVALGLNPGGHKERSGDFRTPEGSYKLTRRNTRGRLKPAHTKSVCQPPRNCCAGYLQRTRDDTLAGHGVDQTAL